MPDVFLPCLNKDYDDDDESIPAVPIPPPGGGGLTFGH